MNQRIRLACCAIAYVLMACSGTENRLGGKDALGALTGHNVGGNPVGTGGATGAGGTGGLYSSTSTPGFGDPTSPHDFAAGKWTGYIENYDWAGRSDALTLELDTLSQTSVTGKIVFGDASAPVPDYSDPHPYIGNGVGGSANDDVPAESYPFTVAGATLSGTRLRFTVLNDEIWSSWCVQQTPIPDAINAGMYRCVENVSVAADANGCYVGHFGGRRLDCTQVQLCRDVCFCDASSCFIGGREVQFDVSIQGDRMDGSVVGLGNALNVHLTRE